MLSSISEQRKQPQIDDSVRRPNRLAGSRNAFQLRSNPHLTPEEYPQEFVGVVCELNKNGPPETFHSASFIDHAIVWGGGMDDSVRYETGVWVGSLHTTAPTPPVEVRTRAPRARTRAALTATCGRVRIGCSLHNTTARSSHRSRCCCCRRPALRRGLGRAAEDAPVHHLLPHDARRRGRQRGQPVVGARDPRPRHRHRHCGDAHRVRRARGARARERRRGASHSMFRTATRRNCRRHRVRRARGVREGRRMARHTQCSLPPRRNCRRHRVRRARGAPGARWGAERARGVSRSSRAASRESE